MAGGKNKKTWRKALDNGILSPLYWFSGASRA
jgi:hypothetical protein